MTRRKRKPAKAGAAESTESSLGSQSNGRPPVDRARSMKPSGRNASPRPGRLEHSSLAFNLIGQLGRTSVPGAPAPNLYVGATGRAWATEVIRDRIMFSRPGLYLPWSSTMGPFSAGDNYFQQGTNHDTIVNSVVGPLWKAMYGNIVRELIIDGNIAMRDTSLQNIGGHDALAFWISQYSSAFTTLRGLQGCLGMGNFNYPASVLANSVNQQVFLLEGALRQLFTYSVPPMLIEFLDRMCGPIALSEDDPLIIPGVNTNSPQVDLTNSTNVANLITSITTNVFPLLSSGDGVLLSAPDAQAIGNTFGMAYGTPDVTVSKEIQYDAATYRMHQFSAATYRNSGTTTAFTWPNANVASGNEAGFFPIMVPRGYKGPCLRQMLSLFRPGLYTIDPVAGITATGAGVANQVGWTSNQAVTTNGSGGIDYDESGVYSSRTNNASGTGVYDYTQLETELLPWIAEAALAANNYGFERRTFPGVDIIYVTIGQVVDETMFLMEEMFLNPIRGGSRGYKK